MTFKLKSAISIACIAAFAPAAYADTSNNDIPEIVVTAKGEQSTDDVLYTAHVFTEQDIEQAQVKSIPALLQRIGGISTTDSGGRGSATSVFVRGVSTSQIVVLIDGVRVGSATLGAAALNSYPVEAIERIEVLKGPFSGIYGADAVGGVIQLFTKKGQRNESVVSASVGSNNLREARAAFGIGNERNSLHISADVEETDGIDRTSILTGGNDDVDAYEETAFSLGARVSFTDNTVANLNLLATDNTVEFDNLFGDGVGNQTENETFSAAFNLVHQFNDSITWTTTVGANEDDAKTTSSFPSRFKTERDSLGTEFQFNLSDNTVITTGVDYYEEDIETTSNFPVTNRDNTGAYAQIQTGFGKLDAVASLRADDNSAYGDQTNGSLALGYLFTDTLRLSASYGTAFVAPSFNFLYFPFFGNPDIQPEESESIEVSLTGQAGNTYWRVSAYQTDVENLFSFDPLTFTAANIGEAELKGVELELNTTVYDWQLGIQADLLDATDKLTGIELDDRPERSLSLNASRNYGDLSLSFDVRSETGRFDRRGTAIAGYGLFDVSAIYQLTDNLSVRANVDNVFDKDYTVNLATSTERFNTEGRQAELTLRYTF